LTIQEQPTLSTAAYGPNARLRSEADRELVLLHLAGDPDAFSIIAENHYKQLIGRARSLLGPYGEVEDAVQETFLRALRGLKQFGRTGEYRLGAWLNTILSNVCSDQRARASRDVLLAQSASHQVRDHGDVADEVSDPQTVETVRSAIRELPPRLRSAFIRHELDEVPYSVLAEMEDSTVELARTRVHRAKSSLRQSLAGIESAVGGFISLSWLRTRLGSGSRSARILGADPLGVSAAPAGLGRGKAPTLFDRVVAPLTSTPLGQSALTLVTGNPRGSLLFGFAATVATFSASAVIVAAVAPPTPPSTPHVTLTADVVSAAGSGAASVAEQSLATPVSTSNSGTPSTSTTTSGLGSTSEYGWVNAGTAAGGTAGGSAPVIAGAPGCTVPSTVGVTPNSSYLGLGSAVSAASAAAVPFPTVNPVVEFSTAASLGSFGSATASSIDVTITTNACTSSGDPWFSAQVTGLGTTTPLLLTGTLVEIVGSAGDLGYIFRGDVSTPAGASSAAAALLDGATQFVAQLAVSEPANTAQLTVVFLSPTASSSSASGSSVDTTQPAQPGATAGAVQQSASVAAGDLSAGGEAAGLGQLSPSLAVTTASVPFSGAVIPVTGSVIQGALAPFGGTIAGGSVSSSAGSR
jgi:RNA polymerase sigma-70 factor (ECF subfamily)